jgi:hypothetical protein
MLKKAGARDGTLSAELHRLGGACLVSVSGLQDLISHLAGDVEGVWGYIYRWNM